MQITLDQLRQTYAYNDRRSHLIARLEDELTAWRQNVPDLKVWIYGSYLTNKEEPGDIDILLSYRVSSFPPLPLPRQFPDEVHVRQLRGNKTSTKAEVIVAFNEQDTNVAKGIRVSEDQVAELILL